VNRNPTGSPGRELIITDDVNSFCSTAGITAVFCNGTSTNTGGQFIWTYPYASTSITTPVTCQFRCTLLTTLTPKNYTNTLNPIVDQRVGGGQGNGACTSTDADFTVGLLQTDLSISKVGTSSSQLGNNVTYTITVTNLLAQPLLSGYVNVTDSFPSTLSVVQWTCTGGACLATSGTGSFPTPYTLGSFPASSNVVFTVSASVIGGSGTTINNTAFVSYSGDTVSSNNAATASTSILGASLSITKTDNTVALAAGLQQTYKISVWPINGVPTTSVTTVSDTFSSTFFSAVTWTCSSTPSGSCSGGSGFSLYDIANIPFGSTAVYTIITTLKADQTGTLTNSAGAASNGGISGAFLIANATDTTRIDAVVDLVLQKDDSVTSVIPGHNVTYTISASNNGPSDALLTTLTDTFSTFLKGVQWACSANAKASCSPSSFGYGSISQQPMYVLTLSSLGTILILYVIIDYT